MFNKLINIDYLKLPYILEIESYTKIINDIHLQCKFGH